jgi:hypothetical protein
MDNFTVNGAIKALLQDKYHDNDDARWLQAKKSFIR